MIIVLLLLSGCATSVGVQNQDSQGSFTFNSEEAMAAAAEKKSSFYASLDDMYQCKTDKDGFRYFTIFNETTDIFDFASEKKRSRIGSAKKGEHIIVMRTSGAMAEICFSGSSGWIESASMRPFKV